MDEETSKSLWVRVEQIGTGDIVVDVYCRPPDREEVDEALYQWHPQIYGLCSSWGLQTP